MIITLVSVILFAILVAVPFVGGRLARVLPEEQLGDESKDAMKLALGLVATMTAILLGLLISSAKGSFDTARSQVMQMAAKVALLDRVLKLYGPETKDARDALRDAIADGVARTWPAERSGPVRLDPNQQMGDAIYVTVSHLEPHNELQRALKTQAATLMMQLAEIRALVQAQAVSSVAKPLLIALVLWLLVLFFCLLPLPPPQGRNTLPFVSRAVSGAIGAFF